MFCTALGSYALYPMGFYELQPRYECNYNRLGDGQSWYPCTNVDFCQNLQFDLDPRNDTGHVLTTDMLPEYRVVESPVSLDNWIQQYGLQCAPKNQFGLFGSSFFIGLVLGSFIVPRISDLYGRKKLAIFGCITHFLASMLVLITHSFGLSIAMIFIMGFSMGGRAFVGYVFMSEHMKTADVARVTSLYFFMDSSGIFWAALYFKYVSKDWRLIFGFPSVVLIFAIYAYSLQDETPKFFYG